MSKTNKIIKIIADPQNKTAKLFTNTTNTLELTDRVYIYSDYANCATYTISADELSLFFNSYYEVAIKTSNSSTENDYTSSITYFNYFYSGVIWIWDPSGVKIPIWRRNFTQISNTLYNNTNETLPNAYEITTIDELVNYINSPITTTTYYNTLKPTVTADGINTIYYTIDYSGHKVTLNHTALNKLIYAYKNADGGITITYRTTHNVELSKNIETLTANPLGVIGSITGTVLNVIAITSGKVIVGTKLSGVGVVPGTTVTEIITGNGGIGTYSVNISQNVLNTNITPQITDGVLVTPLDYYLTSDFITLETTITPLVQNYNYRLKNTDLLSRADYGIYNTESYGASIINSTKDYIEISYKSLPIESQPGSNDWITDGANLVLDLSISNPKLVIDPTSWVFISNIYVKGGNFELGRVNDGLFGEYKNRSQTYVKTYDTQITKTVFGKPTWDVLNAFYNFKLTATLNATNIRFNTVGLSEVQLGLNHYSISPASLTLTYTGSIQAYDLVLEKGLTNIAVLKAYAYGATYNGFNSIRIASLVIGDALSPMTTLTPHIIADQSYDLTFLPVELVFYNYELDNFTETTDGDTDWLCRFNENWINGSKCEFTGGVSLGSKWYNGTFSGGDWFSGYWTQGVISGGNFYDGVINSRLQPAFSHSYWSDVYDTDAALTIKSGGDIYGADWRNGTHTGGSITSDFQLTIWRNGVFENGTTSDVKWITGKFTGGEFNTALNTSIQKITALDAQIFATTCKALDSYDPILGDVKRIIDARQNVSLIYNNVIDVNKSPLENYSRKANPIYNITLSNTDVDETYNSQKFLSRILEYQDHKIDVTRAVIDTKSFAIHNIKISYDEASIYNNTYETVNQFNTILWDIDINSISNVLGGYTSSPIYDFTIKRDFNAVDLSQLKQTNTPLADSNFNKTLINEYLFNQGRISGDYASDITYQKTYQHLDSIDFSKTSLGDRGKITQSTITSGEFTGGELNWINMSPEIFYLDTLIEASNTNLTDGTYYIDNINTEISIKFELNPDVTELELKNILKIGSMVSFWNLKTISGSIDALQLNNYQLVQQSAITYIICKFIFDGAVIEKYNMLTDTGDISIIQQTFDNNRYQALFNHSAMSPIVFNGATMNSGTWVNGVLTSGTHAGFNNFKAIRDDWSSVWLNGYWKGDDNAIHSGGLFLGGVMINSKFTGGVLDNAYNWTVVVNTEFGSDGSTTIPVMQGGLIEGETQVFGLYYIAGTINWIRDWHNGVWGNGKDISNRLLYSGKNGVYKNNIINNKNNLWTDLTSLADINAKIANTTSEAELRKLKLLEYYYTSGGGSAKIYNLAIDTNASGTYLTTRVIEPHKFQTGYRIMAHDIFKETYSVPLFKDREIYVNQVYSLKDTDLWYKNTAPVSWVEKYSVDTTALYYNKTHFTEFTSSVNKYSNFGKRFSDRDAWSFDIYINDWQIDANQPVATLNLKNFIDDLYYDISNDSWVQPLTYGANDGLNIVNLTELSFPFTGNVGLPGVTNNNNDYNTILFSTQTAWSINDINTIFSTTPMYSTRITSIETNGVTNQLNIYIDQLEEKNLTETLTALLVELNSLSIGVWSISNNTLYVNQTDEAFGNIVLDFYDYGTNDNLSLDSTDVYSTQRVILTTLQNTIIDTTYNDITHYDKLYKGLTSFTSKVLNCQTWYNGIWNGNVEYQKVGQPIYTYSPFVDINEYKPNKLAKISVKTPGTSTSALWLCGNFNDGVWLNGTFSASRFIKNYFANGDWLDGVINDGVILGGNFEHIWLEKGWFSNNSNNTNITLIDSITPVTSITYRMSYELLNDNKEWDINKAINVVNTLVDNPDYYQQWGDSQYWIYDLEANSTTPLPLSYTGNPYIYGYESMGRGADFTLRTFITKPKINLQPFKTVQYKSLHYIEDINTNRTVNPLWSPITSYNDIPYKVGDWITATNQFITETIDVISVSKTFPLYSKTFLNIKETSQTGIEVITPNTDITNGFNTTPYFNTHFNNTNKNVIRATVDAKWLPYLNTNNEIFLNANRTGETDPRLINFWKIVHIGAEFVPKMTSKITTSLVGTTLTITTDMLFNYGDIVLDLDVDANPSNEDNILVIPNFTSKTIIFAYQELGSIGTDNYILGFIDYTQYDAVLGNNILLFTVEPYANDVFITYFGANTPKVIDLYLENTQYETITSTQRFAPMYDNDLYYSDTVIRDFTQNEYWIELNTVFKINQIDKVQNIGDNFWRNAGQWDIKFNVPGFVQTRDQHFTVSNYASKYNYNIFYGNTYFDRNISITTDLSRLPEAGFTVPPNSEQLTLSAIWETTPGRSGNIYELLHRTPVPTFGIDTLQHMTYGVSIDHRTQLWNKLFINQNKNTNQFKFVSNTSAANPTNLFVYGVDVESNMKYFNTYFTYSNLTNVHNIHNTFIHNCNLSNVDFLNTYIDGYDTKGGYYNTPLVNWKAVNVQKSNVLNVTSMSQIDSALKLSGETLPYFYTNIFEAIELMRLTYETAFNSVNGVAFNTLYPEFKIDILDWSLSYDINAVSINRLQTFDTQYNTVLNELSNTTTIGLQFDRVVELDASAVSLRTLNIGDVSSASPYNIHRDIESAGVSLELSSTYSQDIFLFDKQYFNPLTPIQTIPTINNNWTITNDKYYDPNYWLNNKSLKIYHGEMLEITFEIDAEWGLKWTLLNMIFEPGMMISLSGIETNHHVIYKSWNIHTVYNTGDKVAYRTSSADTGWIYECVVNNTIGAQMYPNTANWSKVCEMWEPNKLWTANSICAWRGEIWVIKTATYTSTASVLAPDEDPIWSRHISGSDTDLGSLSTVPYIIYKREYHQAESDYLGLDSTAYDYNRWIESPFFEHSISTKTLNDGELAYPKTYQGYVENKSLFTIYVKPNTDILNDEQYASLYNTEGHYNRDGGVEVRDINSFLTSYSILNRTNTVYKTYKSISHDMELITNTSLSAYIGRNELTDAITPTVVIPGMETKTYTDFGTTSEQTINRNVYSVGSIGVNGFQAPNVTVSLSTDNKPSQIKGIGTGGSYSNNFVLSGDFKGITPHSQTLNMPTTFSGSYINNTDTYNIDTIQTVLHNGYEINKNFVLNKINNEYFVDIQLFAQFATLVSGNYNVSKTIPYYNSDVFNTSEGIIELLQYLTTNTSSYEFNKDLELHVSPNISRKVHINTELLIPVTTLDTAGTLDTSDDINTLQVYKYATNTYGDAVSYMTTVLDNAIQSNSILVTSLRIRVDSSWATTVINSIKTELEVFATTLVDDATSYSAQSIINTYIANLSTDRIIFYSNTKLSYSVDTQFAIKSYYSDMQYDSSLILTKGKINTGFITKAQMTNTTIGGNNLTWDLVISDAKAVNCTMVSGFWNGGTWTGGVWDNPYVNTSNQAIWNYGVWDNGVWNQGHWFSMTPNGDYKDYMSVWVKGTWNAIGDSPIKLNETNSATLALNYIDSGNNIDYWSKYIRLDSGVNVDYDIDTNNSYDIGGTTLSHNSVWHGGLWNFLDFNSGSTLKSTRIKSYRFTPEWRSYNKSIWSQEYLNKLKINNGQKRFYTGNVPFDRSGAFGVDQNLGIGSNYYKEAMEEAAEIIDSTNSIFNLKFQSYWNSDAVEPYENALAEQLPIEQSFTHAVWESYYWIERLEPTPNFKTADTTYDYTYGTLHNGVGTKWAELSTVSKWKDGVWLRGQWGGGVFYNGRWTSVKAQGQGAYETQSNLYSNWYRGAFYGYWYGGNWNSLRGNKYTNGVQGYYTLNNPAGEPIVVINSTNNPAQYDKRFRLTEATIKYTDKQLRLPNAVDGFRFLLKYTAELRAVDGDTYDDLIKTYTSTTIDPYELNKYLDTSSAELIPGWKQLWDLEAGNQYRNYTYHLDTNQNPDKGWKTINKYPELTAPIDLVPNTETYNRFDVTYEYIVPNYGNTKALFDIADEHSIFGGIVGSSVEPKNPTENFFLGRKIFLLRNNLVINEIESNRIERPAYWQGGVWSGGTFMYSVWDDATIEDISVLWRGGNVFALSDMRVKFNNYNANTFKEVFAYNSAPNTNVFNYSTNIENMNIDSYKSFYNESETKLNEILVSYFNTHDTSNAAYTPYRGAIYNSISANDNGLGYDGINHAFDTNDSLYNQLNKSTYLGLAKREPKRFSYVDPYLHNCAMDYNASYLFDFIAISPNTPYGESASDAYRKPLAITNNLTNLVSIDETRYYDPHHKFDFDLLAGYNAVYALYADNTNIKFTYDVTDPFGFSGLFPSQIDTFSNQRILNNNLPSGVHLSYYNQIEDVNSNKDWSYTNWIKEPSADSIDMSLWMRGYFYRSVWRNGLSINYVNMHKDTKSIVSTVNISNTTSLEANSLYIILKNEYNVTTNEIETQVYNFINGNAEFAYKATGIHASIPILYDVLPILYDELHVNFAIVNGEIVFKNITNNGNIINNDIITDTIYFTITNGSYIYNCAFGEFETNLNVVEAINTQYVGHFTNSALLPANIASNANNVLDYLWRPTDFNTYIDSNYQVESTKYYNNSTVGILNSNFAYEIVNVVNNNKDVITNNNNIIPTVVFLNPFEAAKTNFVNDYDTISSNSKFENAIWYTGLNRWATFTDSVWMGGTWSNGEFINSTWQSGWHANWSKNYNDLNILVYTNNEPVYDFKDETFKTDNLFIDFNAIDKNDLSYKAIFPAYGVSNIQLNVYNWNNNTNINTAGVALISDYDLVIQPNRDIELSDWITFDIRNQYSKPLGYNRSEISGLRFAGGNDNYAAFWQNGKFLGSSFNGGVWATGEFYHLPTDWQGHDWIMDKFYSTTRDISVFTRGIWLSGEFSYPFHKWSERIGVSQTYTLDGQLTTYDELGTVYNPTTGTKSTTPTMDMYLNIELQNSKNKCLFFGISALTESDWLTVGIRLGKFAISKIGVDLVWLKNTIEFSVATYPNWNDTNSTFDVFEGVNNTILQTTDINGIVIDKTNITSSRSSWFNIVNETSSEWTESNDSIKSHMNHNTYSAWFKRSHTITEKVRIPSDIIYNPTDLSSTVKADFTKSPSPYGSAYNANVLNPLIWMNYQLWDNPLYYLDTEWMPLFYNQWNNLNDINTNYTTLDLSNNDKINIFNKTNRYKTNFAAYTGFTNTSSRVFTNLPYTSINQYKSNITTTITNILDSAQTSSMSTIDANISDLVGYENYEYIVDEGKLYYYPSINMSIIQEAYTYRPNLIPYSYLKTSTDWFMKNGVLADTVYSDLTANNTMVENYDIPFNKQSFMNAYEAQSFKLATELTYWYSNFALNFALPNQTSNNQADTAYDEAIKRLNRRWRLVKNQSNVFWQYKFVDSNFNGALLGGVFDDMLRFSHMYPNQVTASEKQLFLDKTNVIIDTPYFKNNKVYFKKVLKENNEYKFINYGKMLPYNTTDVLIPLDGLVESLNGAPRVTITPTAILTFPADRLITLGSEIFGSGVAIIDPGTIIIDQLSSSEPDGSFGRSGVYEINQAQSNLTTFMTHIKIKDDISSETNDQYDSLDTTYYNVNLYDANRGNVILSPIPTANFSDGNVNIRLDFNIDITYYIDKFIDKAVQSNSNRSRMWSKWVPKWSCSAEWANTPSNLVFHYNYTTVDKEYLYYNYGLDYLNKSISQEVLSFPRTNGEGFYPLLSTIYNSNLKSYNISNVETYTISGLNLTTVNANTKGYYPANSRMLKLTPDGYEHSYAYLNMEIYPINTTKWELRKAKMALNLIYGSIPIDGQFGDTEDFDTTVNINFDFQDMIRMSDASSDIRFKESPISSGLAFRYNNMLFSNNIGLANYHRNFGIYKPAQINQIVKQVSPLTMQPIVSVSKESTPNKRIENLLIHMLPNYHWYYSVDVKPMIRAHYSKKSLLHTSGDTINTISLKTAEPIDTTNFVFNSDVVLTSQGANKYTTFDYTSGTFEVNNRTYNVPAGTITVKPNGTDLIFNDRIDIIYLAPLGGTTSSFGKLHYIAGTPSTNPKAPKVPKDGVVIYNILVDGLANEVVNGYKLERQGVYNNTTINNTQTPTYETEAFDTYIDINGQRYYSISVDEMYFTEKTSDYPAYYNFEPEELPDAPVRYYKYEYTDGGLNVDLPYEEIDYKDPTIEKYASTAIKYLLNNGYKFDTSKGDIIYFKPLYVVADKDQLPSKSNRYSLEWFDLKFNTNTSTYNRVHPLKNNWPGAAFDEIHHNYINKSTLHLDYKSGKLVFINNATMAETENIWHDNNTNAHNLGVNDVHLNQSSIKGLVENRSALFTGVELNDLNGGGYDLTTSNISMIEYINWVYVPEGSVEDVTKKWKRIKTTYYLNNKPFIKENVFFRVSEYDGPINLIGFDFIPMTDSMDNNYKKIKYLALYGNNNITTFDANNMYRYYYDEYYSNMLPLPPTEIYPIDAKKWDKYVNITINSWDILHNKPNVMAIGPVHYIGSELVNTGEGLDGSIFGWNLLPGMRLNNFSAVSPLFNSYDWLTPQLDYSTSYPNNFNPAENWYNYTVDTPAKNFYFNRDVINYASSFKALTGNIDYQSEHFRFRYNFNTSVADPYNRTRFYMHCIDNGGTGLTYIDSRFELFRNVNTILETGTPTEIEDTFPVEYDNYNAIFQPYGLHSSTITTTGSLLRTGYSRIYSNVTNTTSVINPLDISFNIWQNQNTNSLTTGSNTATYDLTDNVSGSTNWTTTYVKNSVWEDGKPYFVNDIVIFMGKFYICKISHTSSVNIPIIPGTANNWELYYKEIHSFTNIGALSSAIKQLEPGNVFLTGNKNYLGDHYPFWDTYLLQTNFFIDKSGLDRIWGNEAGYGVVKMKRVQRCPCSMYKEETWLGLNNQGYEIHNFPKKSTMDLNSAIYFRNQKQLLNNRINPRFIEDVTEKEIDLKSATTINTVHMPLSHMSIFGGNTFETIFQSVNTNVTNYETALGSIRVDIGQNLNNFKNKFLVNDVAKYPFNYEFVNLVNPKALLTLDMYYFLKGSTEVYPMTYNKKLYRPHGKFNKII